MGKRLRNQLGINFNKRCTKHRKQACDVRIFAEPQAHGQIELITIRLGFKPPLFGIELLAQGR